MGVTPIPENKKNSKYLYEIIVNTPYRIGAGANSAVNMILVGDFDETIRVSTLRNGQVFRLEHLHYEADSATILGASAQELLGLVAFLQKNKNIHLEIGGHTNSLPSAVYCDSLSTLRARKAVAFLIENGVNENRLSYKGYGKKQPIATNETIHGRQRNQRIEIKIMDTGKKSQLNVSGVSTYKIVPIEPTE